MAELTFIRGATHWAHLEEPQAVVVHLLRFLGTPRTGPAG